MRGVLPPKEELMGGGGMPQGVLPQPAAAMNAAPPEGGGVLAPIEKTQEGGDRGYTGTVMVDGNPVEVVDGIAEFEGEQYFVSKDGSFVVNADGGIFGRVENGEFIPIDDAYLEQLRANGMLEE